MADDVLVLSAGHTVAHGSPRELKARIGGERLEVTVGPEGDLGAAAAALAPFASDAPFVDHAAGLAVAPVDAGVALVDVVRGLDAAGVSVTDLHRREATLDDVFLTLTETEKVAA
jgi:ABC-2 type transport system ATP-binding protein